MTHDPFELLDSYSQHSQVKMATLKPLNVPVNGRSTSSGPNSRIPMLTLLFNNFQQSSLLLAAALIQGVLTWLFPTVLTLLPALLILAYRALDVAMIMGGFRRNRYMDGVVPNRVSAQIPDENGEFGEKPSDKKVVILLLGSRSNHPLGIFSPGYTKVGNFFQEMVQDLEANREEYGFITSQSYISNADPDRNAARELMSTFYFRSMEGLHKFAHGPIHRKGWDWWSRTAKSNPDVSLMHEVYEASPGQWENIYVNFRPTGLATARFPIKPVEGKDSSGMEAETQWVGSIVDASRANMKSARLRLGRD